jgi:hypothetical protein
MQVQEVDLVATLRIFLEATILLQEDQEFNRTLQSIRIDPSLDKVVIIRVTMDRVDKVVIIINIMIQIIKVYKTLIKNGVVIIIAITILEEERVLGREITETTVVGKDLVHTRMKAGIVTEFVEDLIQEIVRVRIIPKVKNDRDLDQEKETITVEHFMSK